MHRNLLPQKKQYALRPTQKPAIKETHLKISSYFVSTILLLVVCLEIAQTTARNASEDKQVNNHKS
jgi:hypothetical protein